MGFTRNLIDPELHSLLDLFGTKELDEKALADLREKIDAMPVPILDVPRVTRTEIEVKSSSGGHSIRMLIFAPDTPEGPLPCLYHMHGGGFIAGTVDSCDPLLRPMAAELDAVCISVDYRLAPETSFPGNIEDCYDGLAYVFEHAEELGIDRGAIGVIGESAGGGLAAALAVLARDRATYPIAFQNLIYPMIDDRTGSTRSGSPVAGEFVWTAQNNAFGWRALLGKEPGGDSVSPHAAAARADDLSGLPPCYLATAALDLFVDENITYARRLMAAGVPTELHAYPMAMHGFDGSPTAAVAVRARADRIAALKRAIARATMRKTV